MALVSSCAELIDLVQRIGFLPLLDSGVPGYSAEAMVDESCRYHTFDGGGWEWKLWKWKGEMVTDGSCMYGKFFDKKAGFVSAQWWPDLLNWRRALYPAPDPESIEGIILDTLRTVGNAVSRDLRRACGFDGKGMRSRFDAYVTRLQMGCHLVTEDFVYSTDRHGRPYGWGLSLLTTPEQLYGAEACRCPRTPEQSRQRIASHLSALLPQATPRQIGRLVGAGIKN